MKRVCWDEAEEDELHDLNQLELGFLLLLSVCLPGIFPFGGISVRFVEGRGSSEIIYVLIPARKSNPFVLAACIATFTEILCVSGGTIGILALAQF